MSYQSKPKVTVSGEGVVPGVATNTVTWSGQHVEPGVAAHKVTVNNTQVPN